MVISRRYHLFEINDQSCFPSVLREKVQATLTLLWTFRVPVLQQLSPAQLVALTIERVLGPKTSEYTYVDFCSGAGGPTPSIERHLNTQLALSAKHGNPSAPVQFLMTDLHPHVEAWEAASKKSENLGFIPEPVNAAKAPKDLLANVETSGRKERLFRLFNLAFHHFDDAVAIDILENTLETADGFGIFELQDRSIASFIMVTLMWPLLLLLTPFFFYNSATHLVFTYLCPIVPFVVMFDGGISSLRTRTPEEVHSLLEVAAERHAKRLRSQRGANGIGHGEDIGGKLLLQDWTFASGTIMHTQPIGKMTWVICKRK